VAAFDRYGLLVLRVSLPAFHLIGG